MIGDCRALLAAHPALRPLQLSPSLGRRHGTFRDAPVGLVAEAWTGGGVAYARVVTIEGPGLSITNVLGLPAARDDGRPPTILGIDLVSVAGAPIVVVADLSPTQPASRETPVAAAQAAVLRARGPFPPGGALPGWCGRWFSPHHLFTRVAAGAAEPALAAAADFARIWLEDTARPGDAASHLPRATAAYCADHRNQDPGLRLLDRMFDPAWAETFRTTVLFPLEPPRSTIEDLPCEILRKSPA